MNLPDTIVSPMAIEKGNWYISFLKEKEKELISQLEYTRVKTQKKVFYCEQGRIEYSFVYVRSDNGIIFSPLRKFL